MTLSAKQVLPLDMKILMSQKRIHEWYDYWSGDVYVSFSGGKDSTVLLDLVRKVHHEVPAVFVDTGLEFPEIREFVKTIDNVTWLKPKLNFKNTIEKYGYPVVSKEQSMAIHRYRNAKSEHHKNYRVTGIKKDGTVGRVGVISKKWRFLIDAPFKISEKCCDVMKKSPIKSFEAREKLKPFIGTMACDSNIRKINYQRYGCNAFEIKQPLSAPLGFWREEDVWSYLETNNVKYSKIYDMGYKRTGCMFCMFGLHMEGKPNRFERMKETHPKQYEYCMKKLGLKDVLSYLEIKKLGDR